jgi:aspartate aminotransferase
MNVVDTRATLAELAAPGGAGRVSDMAAALTASEILKIADQIRGLERDGQKVLNLTVGDFKPSHFPIPGGLLDALKSALDEGHTNYPPSRGMPECREAVRLLYRDRLGLDYPTDSVLIASGARPMIAGTYMTLVNPGDTVVYPLPSWNNNHYCVMTGAKAVEVATDPAHAFFPRVQDLEAHLSTARLVCINTPLNPTGTVMGREALTELSEAIVAENRRRRAAGTPALYLMYDQVYWMLSFGEAAHQTPVHLVPEMAAYTVFVDGVSKGLAATGLRVGWALGPTDVMERMAAILTHVGAWAPRAEQVATARFLSDRDAVASFERDMATRVMARLDALASGIGRLRAAGHDVEAVDPAGAIYLSLRLGMKGRTTPDGQRLETDEDIRAYLLARAGVALVPFSCFGLEDRGEGWFRASVGAVSEDECGRVIQALAGALDALA